MQIVLRHEITNYNIVMELINNYWHFFPKCRLLNDKVSPNSCINIVLLHPGPLGFITNADFSGYILTT